MVTWKGVKIADAGFLINLKHRTDRLDLSLTELEKNEILGVERFNAIKIEEDSDLGWKIRGCTHSHMEVLKKQVENEWQKVIIFEDDFVLDVCHPEINEVSLEIIESISNVNFDLLFLGATLEEKAEYVNSFLVKPNEFVQTTVYISSIKLAEYVVKNFNYLDKESVVYGEQIDSYYSVLSTKKHWRMNANLKDKKEILEHNLLIYFSYPILFNQRISYSDIENKITDYGHYNKFRNIKNYERI